MKTFAFILEMFSKLIGAVILILIADQFQAGKHVQDFLKLKD